jgi:hypothetical protein
MNYLPLAEQCGLIEEHPVNHSSVEYLADLQRFAELVAAQERESIYKIAVENCNDEPANAIITSYMRGQYEMAKYLAERIKARG